MTTPTTYPSASKGEIAISGMNTVHLQNAVAKTRSTGGETALLEALEAELATRTDRTDQETTAA